MSFSMTDALTPDHVQIVEAASDWREAVRVAVAPLAEDGFVEARYADEIIANAEELGPYFVLAPDLALLHARPEQGALKTQLAVTVLRAGAVFKEGADPVRVLVTLAATDSSTHIEVMRQFAGLFANPANIERVACAATPDEIYDIFVG